MMRKTLVSLATLALSTSFALAQTPAPPQDPAPASPPTPPAAPIERRPVAPRPGAMRVPPMDRGNRAPLIVMNRRDGRGDSFHILPPGMWWKNPSIVEKLALTPDQTKKMDDIFQQSRIQLIDLKANVEKQNVLLEPMLSANPPDTAKALAQIDKVAQARADLEKADARMLLGIRGVLTPDQWTKLQSRGPGMGGGPEAPVAPGAPPPPSGPGGRGRGPRPPGGPGAAGGADFVAPEPRF